MKAIQTSRAFGLALREARLERGLTQEELAELAGVSRPWLSELETGKRTAELGRALVVLHTLGLAIDISPVPRGPVDLAELLGEEPRR